MGYVWASRSCSATRRTCRFGRGLRQRKVSGARRLERGLLVLAFAYLLLILIGKECRGQYSPGHWVSGVGRRRQASDLFAGRYMQVYVRLRITVLMHYWLTLYAHWPRKTGDESGVVALDTR
jgi:hypothetical protein